MSGSQWGDFLKEKSQRGSFNRLRNWREDGEIVIWIHTNTKIHKRLFHMIPFVGEREDDQTKKKRTSILYLPFVCHESTHDYMNKTSAKRCPLCLFLDHLRANDKIADHETVWDSSIGDRKRDRICTKADFTGDTDGGGDWRLSFKPALQYVLGTIDHDNPGEGIRVATEKFSLGEAIKKAVQMEVDRRGPELGDPDQNPYAFKWVFNSKARQPADYYTAYPYDRAEMTDEIAELLAKPAEDLGPWITPGDTKKLRDAMEAHVTVDDVDFDELFANVLENVGTRADDEEEVSEIEKPKKTNVTKTRKATPKADPEPEAEEPAEEPPAEEEELPMMECPSCKGTGEKRGKECKVCDGTGLVEAPDEEEEPPPPKKSPPKKTRQAKQTKKAPPPPPEEDMAECGKCGKDVPESANSCPHCGASFE